MNWWWVHETMHNEKRRFSSSFPWQTSRSSHSCCWFARLSDSIASVGFALALACRARSNRIESNETETIDYRLTNIHSPVDVSCLTTEKKTQRVSKTTVQGHVSNRTDDNDIDDEHKLCAKCKRCRFVRVRAQKSAFV